jgi:5-methylcytosine-specific restriction endonuclease McrA
MDVKQCTKCGEHKPLAMFFKDAGSSSGFACHCKDCMRAYRKAYYQKNQSKERQSAQVRYHSDKAYHSQKHQAWRRANPGKDLAKAAARRAAVAGRSPSWLTDDERRETEFIYALARAWSLATKVAHHVDHIVPLRGKDACGLHVPWNLRIIPATENLRKGNRLQSSYHNDIVRAGALRPEPIRDSLTPLQQ